VSRPPLPHLSSSSLTRHSHRVVVVIAELELSRISSSVVVRRYVFDSDEAGYRPRDALTLARARLLEDIKLGSKEYNFLVNEG
jgi:hypothetical protein